MICWKDIAEKQLSVNFQEQLEPIGKTPDITEPKPEEILVDKAPVMMEKAEEGSVIKFRSQTLATPTLPS